MAGSQRRRGSTRGDIGDPDLLHDPLKCFLHKILPIIFILFFEFRAICSASSDTPFGTSTYDINDPRSGIATSPSITFGWPRLRRLTSRIYRFLSLFSSIYPALHATTNIHVCTSLDIISYPAFAYVHTPLRTSSMPRWLPNCHFWKYCTWLCFYHSLQHWDRVRGVEKDCRSDFGNMIIFTGLRVHMLDMVSI